MTTARNRFTFFLVNISQRQFFRSYRLLVAVLALIFALLVLAGGSYAQDKLIILVRHAEKADETSEDPELSEEGRRRVDRLTKIGGRYRPGAFHSTDLKRTRDTIRPLAEKRGKQIEIYDPRKPRELFDKILKSSIKRHIVSGHSNTIPGLANVILNKELFRNLQDSEYSVIWKIRIRNGRVVSAELLDY